MMMGAGRMPVDPRMLELRRRMAARQLAQMAANPGMQRPMGAGAGRMPMDPNAGYRNLYAAATQPQMNQRARGAAMQNFLGNVGRGMRS